MRFLLTFIAGGIFSLTIAIAWMPRAAWIEFLDHIRTPDSPYEHDVHNGKADFHAESLEIIPEFFKKPDGSQIHGPMSNRENIRVLPSNSVFELTPDDVARICISGQGGGSFWYRAHYYVAVTLTDAARERYFRALDNLHGGGEEAVELTVMGVPSELFAIRYYHPVGQSLHRKEFEAYGEDFNFKWWEPNLEHAKDFADYYGKGKALEPCL